MCYDLTPGSYHRLNLPRVFCVSISMQEAVTTAVYSSLASCRNQIQLIREANLNTGVLQISEVSDNNISIIKQDVRSVVVTAK